MNLLLLLWEHSYWKIQPTWAGEDTGDIWHTGHRAEGTYEKQESSLAAGQEAERKLTLGDSSVFFHQLRRQNRKELQDRNALVNSVQNCSELRIRSEKGPFIQQMASHY